MFKRVLLVTDNAQLLEEPLAWVRDLLGEEARYHVLCLVRTRVAVTEALEPIYREISRGQAKRVTKHARKVLKKLDVKVTSEIVEGRPLPAIREVVKEKKIDLIVTENYDDRGYRRKKLDRWIEKVIRNIKVPVLNISRADNLKKPGTILVTDTDNDVSERTEEMALWIAERFGAKLHVVNMVHSDEEGEPFEAFKENAREKGLKVKRLEEPSKWKEWVESNSRKYSLVVMDALHVGILGRLHPAQQAMISDQDLPVLLNWQDMKYRSSWRK